jgi:hypothetical protein
MSFKQPASALLLPIVPIYPVATFVEDQLTPLDFGQMLKVVSDVLPIYTGNTPDEAVLSLVLAKMALETGRGKSVHHHNLGNQKCTVNMTGMYTAFKCDENITVNNVRKRYVFEPSTPFAPGDKYGIPNALYEACPVPPANPQTWFRAFANAYDGAYEYFELLNGLSRYASSWAALKTGDAYKFVHSLAVAGYFTAPEHQYFAGVQSLQKEFVQKLRGRTYTEVSDEIVRDTSLHLPTAIFSLEDVYTIFPDVIEEFSDEPTVS